MVLPATYRTYSPVWKPFHSFPFGLLHRGYNEEKHEIQYTEAEEDKIFTPQVVAGHYKYLYQEQERQEDLNLNWDSFKYRNYDYAIGRFMSVDPLAEKYPYNGVYNFSENRVIDGRELEGLEWIAIAGKGNGSNYSSSNINAFFKRAKTLEKFGYNVYQVSSGAELINALKQETQHAGYVSKIVHFAHGGYNGIYLNYDEGLYANYISYGNWDSRTISDLKESMANGEIKFSNDAIWIMGSCNACSEGGTENDFAYQITKELGITTIAATGQVAPEIINGKETGRLKTDGTFIKLSKQIEVTYTFFESYSITRTFNSMQEFNEFNSNIRGEHVTYSIREIINKEELGDIIDPSQY